jgi:DNA-binding NtrC family response regulator
MMELDVKGPARSQRFPGKLTRARRSKSRQIPPAPAAEKRSLEQVERAYVQRVLATCTTLAEAAASLGINTVTLWRMRKRWGLP